MRIAMWSGPRNLSTAMMYAFGARDDCAVVDEPFYAAYLAKTGLDHPMRAEILAAQSNDANEVISSISGSIPGGKPHFYQKHMAQHMVTGVARGWMREVKNIFLIRHPARVVASYAAKRESPSLDDLGYWQQAELFQEVRATGAAPVVVDSHDIRADPEKILRALCDAIGLSWDPAMLSWPAGGHSDDGVWATHWYGSAHRSTGFAGVEGAMPTPDKDLGDLTNRALPFYHSLHNHRLH